MKVSKVVLIVVALHVLVIGGIVVFEGCSRVKSSTPHYGGQRNPAGQPADTNLVTSMPNPQGPGAGNSWPHRRLSRAMKRRLRHHACATAQPATGSDRASLHRKEG